LLRGANATMRVQLATEPPWRGRVVAILLSKAMGGTAPGGARRRVGRRRFGPRWADRRRPPRRAFAARSWTSPLGGSLGAFGLREGHRPAASARCNSALGTRLRLVDVGAAGISLFREDRDRAPSSRFGSVVRFHITRAPERFAGLRRRDLEDLRGLVSDLKAATTDGAGVKGETGILPETRGVLSWRGSRFARTSRTRRAGAVP